MKQTPVQKGGLSTKMLMLLFYLTFVGSLDRSAQDAAVEETGEVLFSDMRVILLAEKPINN